ncbi:MAG: HEPN domain-containing protein [Candidatus Thiodiazotropha sp.]
MKTSLDHLPESKQRDVSIIVKVLRESFEAVTGQGTSQAKITGRILKIILFGSHAKGSWVDDPENGYVSDYDVLVIVNNEKLVEEYRIWGDAEERIGLKVSAPFSLIVHSLSDVNDRLKEGHYFFKDIRQDGILLYDGNQKPLALPGHLSVEEERAIAERHFEQWFESASRFFFNFKQNFEKGWEKEAAFELHQATERFLSCTLLVFTNYRPKTHNIKHLHALCTEQEPRLMPLFPQDSKFNRRCFGLLKRAYVEARYSEHYKITEDELTWLAEQVAELQELTETVCRERVARLAAASNEAVQD